MELYNECDMPYANYRERLLLSDGTVRCCETGIQIPAGFPYALCQGTYDEPDGEREEEWHDHPQAIEVWRFLRNMNRRHHICFNFEGAEDEMDGFWNEGQDGRMFILSWQSMKKRARKRYEAGLRPRLWAHERANLEGGTFVGALPFSARKKQ